MSSDGRAEITIPTICPRCGAEEPQLVSSSPFGGPDRDRRLDCCGVDVDAVESAETAVDDDPEIVTDGGEDATDFHVVCSVCRADGIWRSYRSGRATETPSTCPECGSQTDEVVPVDGDDYLQTDGGVQAGGSEPRWVREGGQGLPLLPKHTERQAAEDGSDSVDVFLFTCTSCGKRLVNPPGPPSYMECQCGGEFVCHTFGFAEYRRIRWWGDPRLPAEASTEPISDGGISRDDIADQLLEISEDLEQVEEELESFDEDREQMLSSICGDMSVICIDMVGALNYEREGAERYRLDGDQVLTDGGETVPDGVVAVPDETEVPEWAADLEPGQLVAFQSSQRTFEAELLGFSTWVSYRGLPVVKPPDELENDESPDLLVLRGDDLVEDSPEVVTDGGTSVSYRCQDCGTSYQEPPVGVDGPTCGHCGGTLAQSEECVSEREYVISSSASDPVSVFSRDGALDEAESQLADVDRLTDSPHAVRITSHPISDNYTTAEEPEIRTDGSGPGPLQDAHERALESIFQGEFEHLPEHVRDELEANGIDPGDLDPYRGGVRGGLWREDVPQVVATVFDRTEGRLELTVRPADELGHHWEVEWHDLEVEPPAPDTGFQTAAELASEQADVDGEETDPDGLLDRLFRRLQGVLV